MWPWPLPRLHPTQAPALLPAPSPSGCRCKSHILCAAFSTVRSLRIGLELLILIETRAQAEIYRHLSSYIQRERRKLRWQKENFDKLYFSKARAELTLPKGAGRGAGAAGTPPPGSTFSGLWAKGAARPRMYFCKERAGFTSSFAGGLQEPGCARPGSGHHPDLALLGPRRPRGCLPLSEQILRSTRLLKEFCCYPASPCLCGVPRGCRRVPAPLLSALIALMTFPHPKHRRVPLPGSFIAPTASLKEGLFRSVVRADRFTANFISIASYHSWGSIKRMGLVGFIPFLLASRPRGWSF